MWKCLLQKVRRRGRNSSPDWVCWSPAKLAQAMFFLCVWGRVKLRKNGKANCLMDCFEYCRLRVGSGWGAFKGTPLQSLFPGLDITGVLVFYPWAQGEALGWGTTLSLCVLQNGGLDVTASRRVGLATSCRSLFGKAEQKAHPTTGLLMFMPHPSSFCIIKWWSSSHYFSPFRVGTTAFKIHEWVGALSVAAALQ